MESKSLLFPLLTFIKSFSHIVGSHNDLGLSRFQILHFWPLGYFTVAILSLVQLALLVQRGIKVDHSALYSD